MRSILAANAIVAVALALPAHAVEGVLEINQACATATGCFSGDTPGFPVTIDGSAGRSYRLTGDLTVDSSNTDVIRTLITSSDISIDLNGFSIVGPITCSGAGASLSCSGSGSGVGVELNGPGSSVRNGTIRGLGSSGAAIGAKNQAHHLTVRWNGGFGITASDGATIRNSVVFENGSDGIKVGDDSVLSDDVSRDNAGNGITTGAGSQILDVLSHGNGGDGVETTEATLAHRVQVKDNGGFGFEGILAPHTLVRECVCTNNAMGAISSPTKIITSEGLCNS